MKKTGILTMILAILIVTFCLNVYAQQTSAQVAALEKQAMRIQSQIDQAKQQSAAVMNSQVTALKNSLNHMMQQRVNVDAQIAKLESQIEDLQKSSNSVLSRQIDQYNKELSKVKQEMSSLMAQPSPKAAAPAQPAAVAPNVQQNAPAGNAAPAIQGPAVQQMPPAAKPAPAAQKDANLSTKSCPTCPADSAGNPAPVAKQPTVSVNPAAAGKHAVKAQANPVPVPASAKAAQPTTISVGAAQKTPASDKTVANVQAPTASTAK